MLSISATLDKDGMEVGQNLVRILSMPPGLTWEYFMKNAPPNTGENFKDTLIALVKRHDGNLVLTSALPIHPDRSELFGDADLVAILGIRGGANQ